ncbi:DsbA family protein [Providencia vermicola]|uniref:Thioredoxin domain-containing protein n=2 Tax=Providencia TaxID=586 RepID=A0AAI9I0Y2_PROST|nr:MULTISPECIES: DsbA family protein [Providencia]ELR5044754.1 thioredoxin domain-containing protein [Providencia rettgeri]ELR5036602.1 thioredoxin domain-containing protein [Providencia stuartii]ELR5144284.1 thioredoxin domain-containing protein [Providencia stuartii]ELR5293394.1 thioredoxin domain-containing protein [Providencia stuartii]ELX8380850.1 thioredoxin domain-containing protein [Providencia stuartii]
MKKTIVAVLFSSLVFGATAHAAPLTADQEAQVRKLVRDTLVENPEILEEAIVALQAKQGEKQQAQMKETLKAEHDKLFNDPASPRIGAKDAKLVLVNFTDYNCPFCKRFDPQLEEIVKKYPDVAVVIKPLPFKGKTSVESSQLALTLWEKDPKAFQALHQKFMQKQGMLTDENIKQALKATGNEKLVANDKSMETIRTNMMLAEKLGVNGTPATLVGDEMIPGAIDTQQLEAIVKAQLEKVK